MIDVKKLGSAELVQQFYELTMKFSLDRENKELARTVDLYQVEVLRRMAW